MLFAITYKSHCSFSYCVITSTFRVGVDVFLTARSLHVVGCVLSIMHILECIVVADRSFKIKIQFI